MKTIHSYYLASSNKGVDPHLASKVTDTDFDLPNADGIAQTKSKLRTSIMDVWNNNTPWACGVTKCSVEQDSVSMWQFTE